MKLYILSKDKAYDCVACEIISLVTQYPDATLGLATGDTPIEIYKRMVEDHKQNHTSYQQIQTINLDEYVGLANDHPNSYRNYMHEHLFKHVDIDLEYTYFPSLESGFLKWMSQSIIHLQLLGIGNNGHIGFNEPGGSFESSVHEAVLTYETIQQNRKYFSSQVIMPKKAVTLGIKDIMKAQKIILVATGKHKASILKKMLEEPISNRLPASILKKHEHVTIYADFEAASLLDLSHSSYIKKEGFYEICN